jgi:hypothetical protein
LVATHIDVCFACRRRVPIAIDDSVDGGSIESIPNSPFHYRLVT